ncbi:RNA-directed DNA polymerase, eukaryota [Tanacetum coccineum]|uniref:RNA-directed DNA polymerase, eukaryota n=1 Tax=Tanacetum coccineum TaxID=301880 RepID=A0ABQ5JFS1_9ASTR
MNILSLNIQGLGHKTKKEWIKELSSKNKINFMAIQETKSQCVTHMDVKFMWGNSNYDYVHSEAIGNSGGILCVWEASVFKKDYATLSDNFIAIYGTWLPSNSKVLFVAIYAPQQASSKRILWDYMATLVSRWNGEVIMLGDFNEVRNIDERRGSVFNPASARVFNNFILTSGLVDVKMEGYAFTWSHPSGSKMSNSDQVHAELDVLHSVLPFLVTWRIETMVETNCSDPFFLYDSQNKMIRFKKKLQALKIRIRSWVKDQKLKVVGDKNSIKNELIDIDRIVDSGTRLSNMQAADLDRVVSRDEIRLAVWDCGENKSPGPDGYSFEFFKKYWNLILDGPFILNELLHWCKRQKKQAMFFKVDFAKAYDSVRWDYLLDVLEAFGFCDVLFRGMVRVNMKVPSDIVKQAAASIGCGILKNQFRYLGVMVGECMSRIKAWTPTLEKLRSRLSKWKVRTLSIGGRLTLLKAVMGHLVIIVLF